MGSTQQFSLKWNKYRQNWDGFLGKLLGTHIFSDVIVACDGHFFKLHRIVLASCSAYFEKTLQDVPAKETPVVMLSDISELEMQTLIKFMYCGEATVEQPLLEPLLKAAERLQIKGLIKSDDGESDDDDSVDSDSDAQRRVQQDARRRPQTGPENGRSAAESQRRSSSCSGGGMEVNGGLERRRGAEGSFMSQGAGSVVEKSSCAPMVNGGHGDDRGGDDSTVEDGVVYSDRDDGDEDEDCDDTDQMINPLSVCQPQTNDSGDSWDECESGSLGAVGFDENGDDSTAMAEVGATSASPDIKPQITITPFIREMAAQSPVTSLPPAPVSRPLPPLLPYQNGHHHPQHAMHAPTPPPPPGYFLPPAAAHAPPPPSNPVSLGPAAFMGLSKRNSADSPQVRAALLQISAGEITVAEASIRYDIPIPTLYVNMRRAGIKARGRVSMTGIRKPRGILSIEMSHALDEIRRGTITASKASRKYNITLPRIMSWMRKMGIRSAFAKTPMPPPPAPSAPRPTIPFPSTSASFMNLPLGAPPSLMIKMELASPEKNIGFNN